MIESFFKPSCEKIEESVREQLEGFKPEHILITGGYGESRHLQMRLQNASPGPSCKLTTPNDEP
jgi:hypothetical protein